MPGCASSEFLGETLRKAGLISFAQIQVALADLEFNQNFRLGETLVTRGWIKQRTADFFADEWDFLVRQSTKYPLGYYLEHSGLLTEQQILLILQEQKLLWLKFGSIAVLKGFINQNTLDFFLDSLFPLALLESASKGNHQTRNYKTAQVQISNKLETESATSSDFPKVDYEDIPWID